jgi:hypothetical protein
MPNNELLELARISLLNAGAQSIRYDATEDARMSYEVFAKNGRVVVIQGRYSINRKILKSMWLLRSHI